VGGLTRFSPDGQRTFLSERDGLQGRVVLALHPDAQGNLWVATERGSVAFFEQPLFAAAGPRHQPGAEHILDRERTANGVDARSPCPRFRLRNGVVLRPPNCGGGARRTRMLQGDSRGNMWIGSVSGHVTIAYADGTFKTLPIDIGNVNCLAEDASGAMWVCGGRGLGRLVGERFTSITQAHGFPATPKRSSRMRMVHCGSASAPASSAGIAPSSRRRARHWQAASLSAVQHHRRCGGNAVTDGSPTAERALDGHLWFATSGGVTVVDRTISASRG
jgi:ligand-binding sensor domain-containing protein